MPGQQPSQQQELPNLPYERWLSAKQVGAEFLVNEDTVLRWWHVGLPTGREIPGRMVRRRGFKDYLFHPEVVQFIKKEVESLC